MLYPQNGDRIVPVDFVTLFFTIITNKPFIGFWQPRKAGLNKHKLTGKCMHTQNRITVFTGNDLVQIE